MSDLGEQKSIRLFDDQEEFFQNEVEQVTHSSFNQHIRKAFDKYLVEEFDFETERNVT